MSVPAVTTPATGPRQAAVIFVFVTVLIDVLAFGIVIPVLPQLIRGFVGGDYAAAAIWVGTFAAIYAIAQFFCSPILGALSDRFGRRPVILLSNLGLGLNFTLMALATSLPVLFAARLVSGLAGSSSGTANAYIADVTTPDKRASAFGLLGAAFGIGFVIGPALGGVLGAIHLRLPFWFAAGLALTNFLYGYFVLPESLPREKRSTTFEWKRANPFGSLLLLRSYRHVFGLAGLVFVSNLAHYALPSTFVLYADYRYGWSEQKVGYVLAFVGLCNAIVQAALVRRVVPRFGERRALLTGLAFGAAGFATMGLAPEGMLFLIGVPLLGLWGLSGPSIQALLTRRVPEDQQGRLQGAVTSLAAVAGIFAPWLFTHVFAWFIDNPNGLHVPGAAFLLSASLLLGGFVLAWRVAR